MTLADFLDNWLLRHIYSSAQRSDAPRLAGDMLLDASQLGIDRRDLEKELGQLLEDFLAARISMAGQERVCWTQTRHPGWGAAGMVWTRGDERR